jgi:hypothetical protein
MPQLYPNTLLQYAFGELNAQAKNNYEHIILSDNALQQQYFEIDNLLSSLSKTNALPSQTTIAAILNYA